MGVRDTVLNELMYTLRNIFTIMQKIGKQGTSIMAKLPESSLGMISSVQEDIISYMAKFL